MTRFSTELTVSQWAIAVSCPVTLSTAACRLVVHQVFSGVLCRYWCAQHQEVGQADQYFESGSNTVPLLLLTAMQTPRKGKKWEHAGQKRREEMPSVYRQEAQREGEVIKSRSEEWRSTSLRQDFALQVHRLQTEMVLEFELIQKML